MEITMYEDGSYNTYTRENAAQMKRKFTLDLNGATRVSKKVRAMGAQPNFNTLLTSPDLHRLKLGSPELEQMVLQQGSSLLSNANEFSFPSPAKVPPTSSTAEDFVKGFQDTLEQFHKGSATVASTTTTAPIVSSVQGVHTSSFSSNEYVYTQLENSQSDAGPPLQQVPVTSCSSNEEPFYPTQIKEEPQTVPSVCGSPPLSPIDMENQEKIKLERKRMRNRIAASKCRKRKLERICKLEDKVKELKGENTDLQNVVNKLRDSVCLLKQEVMEHVHAGCSIPFIGGGHQQQQ